MGLELSVSVEPGTVTISTEKEKGQEAAKDMSEACYHFTRSRRSEEQPVVSAMALIVLGGVRSDHGNRSGCDVAENSSA
jgi:hypothetical protein